MSVMRELWTNPSFLEALAKKTQAAAAPVAAPAPVTCAAPVSDPKVVAIQKGLKMIGYDPGQIDGIMGKNTHAAIKQLQHAYSLPATGVMDAKTQSAFAQSLTVKVNLDVAAGVVNGVTASVVAAGEKQKADDAAKHIADFKQRISNARSNIKALEHAVAESNELRESTSSWVTGPVHAYGGSWEQIEIRDFQKTNILLTSAQKALADGNFSGAEEFLRLSDGEFSLLNDRFAKYGEGIQKGGERVVSGLKVVKVASAATVGIVAAIPVAAGGLGLGMVGVAAVGGINAGAQNLAQQESEVGHGLRDKINFKDLAVESVIGAVTSYFGGKLGNMVVEKLMGTAAAASLGRKAVAALVGDYLAGSLGGTANVTIQTLYLKAQGSGRDVTWEQFIDQLVDQFTDPSQVLTNIVVGHVSRAAGGQVGGAKKVSAGGHAEASTGSHQGTGDVKTQGNAHQPPEPPIGPKGGPTEPSAGDTIPGHPVHPGYPAVRPPAAPARVNANSFPPSPGGEAVGSELASHLKSLKANELIFEETLDPAFLEEGAPFAIDKFKGVAPEPVIEAYYAGLEAFFAKSNFKKVTVVNKIGDITLTKVIK